MFIIVQPVITEIPTDKYKNLTKLNNTCNMYE